MVYSALGAARPLRAFSEKGTAEVRAINAMERRMANWTMFGGGWRLQNERREGGSWIATATGQSLQRKELAKSTALD